MQIINAEDIAQAKSQDTVFISSPDKSEAICFKPQELEDLIAELSSGRINLDYLAGHLKLTSHQLHYVIEYLLKTGRVNGELTYSTFTSSGASRLLHLEKAAAHKREHRRQMMEKNRTR